MESEAGEAGSQVDRSTDELIGTASEQLDPWVDYGNEMSRSERALFVSRALPDAWMPWSSALRWDFPPTSPLPDSPIDLRVGGDAPPRTLAELVEAVDFGLGLNLNLPDGFDLSQLAPLIPNLEYFCVSSNGTVTGWEALDHARRLVQLIVRADVGGGIPSAALPALTRVIGPSELIRVACAAPNLAELQVDLGSKPWPAGLGFDGPIEYLEIAHAGKLAEPPRLRFPGALRTLRIYNARDLDLGALAPGVDLEWLQVFRTKVLHGAATIAGMTRLRTLELESVANIPGAEALSSVTARQVNLRHSDPAAAAAVQR